jgi:hypothetical protein
MAFSNSLIQESWQQGGFRESLRMLTPVPPLSFQPPNAAKQPTLLVVQT